jgi:hypothetical protein
MTKAFGRLADRFVLAFVPKTTAGACPCNDCWYTHCPNTLCKRCCSNCNCTQTTCSLCSYPPTSC